MQKIKKRFQLSVALFLEVSIKRKVHSLECPSNAISNLISENVEIDFKFRINRVLQEFKKIVLVYLILHFLKFLNFFLGGGPK